MFLARPIVGSMLAMVALTTQAHASFTLDFEQVGANVVATGAGTIDTTGYMLNGSLSTVGITPSEPEFLVGNAAAGYQTLNTFGSFTAQPFGPGGSSNPTSSIGSAVGFGFYTGFFFTNLSLDFIATPESYVSGTALNNTTTWNNATFASLGLTVGTYTYNYGPAADQFVIVEVGTGTAVPEPASWALVLGGLGYVTLGRRRQQRA